MPRRKPTASAAPGDPRIVHEGRGGYVEIDGRRYAIELVEGGSFVIHFPCSNRHTKLAAHREILHRLAEERRWYVEDRSRKPRSG